MTDSELKSRFLACADLASVLSVYSELRGLPDKGSEVLSGVLSGYMESPSVLVDLEERKALKWLFLYAGLEHIESLQAEILSLVTSEGFGASVPESDWLVCEISRLLGVLSGEGGNVVLEELIMHGTMCKSVREQIFMTLVFRWIANKDDDASFGGVISRLLEHLPEDFATPELIMAIIVNAVAVGGNSMREKILEFYQAHSEAAGDMLTMHNVRNFFEIGRPRMKAMMVENYMGMYGKDEAEIQRSLDFMPDERPIAERNRTTKPIVREEPKIGRNDPCPCGSGKKYKKCCGANK